MEKFVTVYNKKKQKKIAIGFLQEPIISGTEEVIKWSRWPFLLEETPSHFYKGWLSIVDITLLPSTPVSNHQLRSETKQPQAGSERRVAMLGCGKAVALTGNRVCETFMVLCVSVLKFLYLAIKVVRISSNSGKGRCCLRIDLSTIGSQHQCVK